MKSLRRTCAVAMLGMVLAVSVFAGTIHSPGSVPPPPPSDTETSTATSTSTSTSTSTDITTTIILTILDLIR